MNDPQSGYASYHLCIFDISSLQQIYRNEWSRLSKELSLYSYDYEAGYDWCVIQALNNILACKNIKGVNTHYKHDVYMCIYRDIGSLFEMYLAAQMLDFNPSDRYRNNPASYFEPSLKAMVNGTNLLVARGTVANL